MINQGEYVFLSLFLEASESLPKILWRKYNSKILTYNELEAHIPSHILKTLNNTQTEEFVNANQFLFTYNKEGGGA